MSSTQFSSSSGFSTETLPKFQLSDATNPGTTAMLGRIPIIFPDPDSATIGSQFVTTPGAWSIEIYEVVAGVLGALVDSRTGLLGTANIVWIALDPGIYDAVKTYRVIIKDAGSVTADEWDFACFQPSIATGVAGVAAINDAIRRIAGLLGYRQRVTYSSYILGVPTVTTIELLDAAGATMASYRRTLTLNESHAITASTSAALDSNTL